MAFPAEPQHSLSGSQALFHCSTLWFQHSGGLTLAGDHHPSPSHQSTGDRTFSSCPAWLRFHSKLGAWHSSVSIKKKKCPEVFAFFQIQSENSPGNLKNSAEQLQSANCPPQEEVLHSFPGAAPGVGLSYPLRVPSNTGYSVIYWAVVCPQ